MQKVKTFEVTIPVTKINFMINCGCKFTVFTNNFNIKKEKFILPFRKHRKGHVGMTRIQELL